MCCFTQPVRQVSATRIFARPLPNGRQILTYSMKLELNEDLAIVLPLPVPLGSAEDAVRFIDLSKEPGFFNKLERLFPVPEPKRDPWTVGSFNATVIRRELEVSVVGDFEASFVPSVADFDRLDPRFRFPVGVWENLPGYADWGFCVFKLRPRAIANMKSPGVGDIHPMAFDFPRRDSASVFFPTVHIHDGQVHATANFDHTLFCQGDLEWAAMLDWERSTSPAPEFSKAAAFVRTGSPVFRKKLTSQLPNQDTLIDEWNLRRKTAVGPSFRFWMTPGGEPDRSGNNPISEPLLRIKQALHTEFTELFTANANLWGLCPFDVSLPMANWAHKVYGFQNDSSQMPLECLVTFASFHPEVSGITISFVKYPRRSVRQAIKTAIKTTIDRVMAEDMRKSDSLTLNDRLSLETKELITLADEEDPDGFCSRFPYPFFVYHDGTITPQPLCNPAWYGPPSTVIEPPSFALVVQPLFKRAGIISTPQAAILIGRAGSCDVVLRSPAVAKEHAYVLRNAVGSSRVDLQACKLEYSIVSPK